MIGRNVCVKTKKSIIGAPGFGFPISCSVSKPEYVKDDLGRISSPL